TVPVNFLAIYLYNKFLPILGPLKMWMAVASSVLFVNLGAASLLSNFPQFIFIQCIWKDIYILLMFKQLWSMIQCTIISSRAKYLYGLIFSFGTLGSCLCSCIPSFWVLDIGSESLFYFTLPFYLILMLAFRKAYQNSTMSWKKEIITNPSASEGLSLIAKNRYLAAILLLVIAMQVSAGFMEFRFNMFLEEHLLDKDLRTAYCAQLFGMMNVLSIVLQAIGSFLCVHFLGLRRTHFMIPFLLLSSAVCSWMIPSFALISFSYVFLKAIDFSLFSVGREMLYIPFGLDVKYRAKAVIDVFAYRSSKALVSISILGLQALAGVYLLEIASYISVAIFIAWICIVFFMIRHYEEPIKNTVL
ncbi:MAG TPA: Npt1/Npt2 family nucleotide transporter, partial [Chlamydiales bacterium]|nr:Npt1/Npt2 family nucleotide transporter [Chlamydiales bacterium]